MLLQQERKENENKGKKRKSKVVTRKDVWIGPSHVIKPHMTSDKNKPAQIYPKGREILSVRGSLAFKLGCLPFEGLVLSSHSRK